MKTIQLHLTDILYLAQMMDEARHSTDADSEPRRADRLYRLFTRTENITLSLDQSPMSAARSVGMPDGQRGRSAL